MAIHATLHIIGPITFSVENKDLQRVGMDYIDDLKMEFHPTYDDFLKACPNADVYYVTRYAKTVYSSYDFSKKIGDVYLMFGLRKDKTFGSPIYKIAQKQRKQKRYLI